MDKIIIKGAREHNLKNIDLEIPRDKFIVITGLSGSGKSSLAFDTIYSEGQRRYIESLSAYARQFLGNYDKPDVDLIEGLSPSLSIEQKSTSANPRSTVGTITEIYDFLRLLYAKIGIAYCYNCGIEIKKQSTDQIINSILQDYSGKKIMILAPQVRGRKGHYKELFEQIWRDGFVKTRVDGKILDYKPNMQVARYSVHNIEIVVDSLVINKGAERRLSESVNVALSYGNGVLIVNSEGVDKIFSKELACPTCGISYGEIAPNSFSFNSIYGACSNCSGLGYTKEFDIDLIVPDKSLSINQGAIEPLGKPDSSVYFKQIEHILKENGYSFDTPIKKIPSELFETIFYGSNKTYFIKVKLSDGSVYEYEFSFKGIIKILDDFLAKTNRNSQKYEFYSSFMINKKCSACNGYRLKKEALHIKINKKNIGEVTELPIDEVKEFITNLKLTEREKEIASQIIKEIVTRLDFLLNVGLNYLTLNRTADTLSGGEAQRIRLATQIGTQLTGVLYVLDEPSIGLHQRDNIKLINSLKSLRDIGNTVIVVEHDKETILNADHIIDLGPRAAEHGGTIVINSPSENIFKNKITVDNSLTLDYLLNKKSIPVNLSPRKGNGNYLELFGASGNNLKNIDVRFPLGTFICVTGVSGSGKSTLINETLCKILYKHIYKSSVIPLKYKSIKGLKHIDKIIEIDQSPIGRTPRSNPATYTNVFTLIRELFAQLPESQIRGYKAGRFSFNVPGGRCQDCEGDGLKEIVMNFLPSVYVQCETCKGKRYNRETLEVLYKGKSISDVLDMTVEEAYEFFKDLPRINRIIKTLYDVGLGYIKLGQQATTLSGGEAQRVKLATELAKVQTGRTLYILDEPTTGLHFEDVRILLDVLNSLVDKGNTVIVIEHNLDVIKSADWIIDLGPEGGKEGGYLIAEGTINDIINNEKSYTGKFLKLELNRN